MEVITDGAPILPLVSWLVNPLTSLWFAGIPSFGFFGVTPLGHAPPCCGMGCTRPCGGCAVMGGNTQGFMKEGLSRMSSI